jgi:hypothetical protein
VYSISTSKLAGDTCPKFNKNWTRYITPFLSNFEFHSFVQTWATWVKCFTVYIISIIICIFPFLYTWR